MTNITDDEFTAIYDVSDQTSLGFSINAVTSLIKTTLGCDTCTPDELTLIQWTTGKATLEQPAEYAGSTFLGTANICSTTAWGYETNFKCPEFINYDQLMHLNTSTAYNLFDSERMISLDDEVTASIVTSFMMNNELAPALDSLY